MTDSEIEEYLKNHSYSVDPQDCTIKMFNTSKQIINKDYDFDTQMMTVITPEHQFTFYWNLQEIRENF